MGEDFLVRGVRGQFRMLSHQILRLLCERPSVKPAPSAQRGALNPFCLEIAVLRSTSTLSFISSLRL